MFNTKISNYIFSAFSGVTLLIVLLMFNFLFASDFHAILKGEKEGIRNTVIRASLPQNILSESENNDTYETANRIQLNTEYYGTLSDSWKNGEQDWFIFTLPKSGSVGFTLRTIEQPNSEENYWNPTIRKADTPDERYLNVYVKGKTIERISDSYYLSAGDYYFEIESSNEYSSDIYRFIINYDDQIEKYIGSYMGGQGLTDCILYTKWTNDNIDATFAFFENSENPGVPSGNFKMTGNVEDMNDDGSYNVKFNGEKWINQPEGYSMLSFTAVVDKEKGTIKSEDYNINLLREDLVAQ